MSSNPLTGEPGEHLVISLELPSDGDGDLAEEAYNEGLALARAGRVRDALPLFSRAAATNPLNALFAKSLGHAFLELGDPDAALAALHNAADIAPGDADLLTLIGNTHLSYGDAAEAEKLYRRSLSIERTPEALTNLGVVLVRRGDLEAAILLFSEAVRIDPAYANARESLAVAQTHRPRHSTSSAPSDNV